MIDSNRPSGAFSYIMDVMKVDLSLFNESHMVAIILYIRDHSGCSKTDIYRDVVRGDRVSKKIDILAEQDIVAISDCGRRSVLRLTPCGEEVAGYILKIADASSGL